MHIAKTALLFAAFFLTQTAHAKFPNVGQTLCAVKPLSGIANSTSLLITIMPSGAITWEEGADTIFHGEVHQLSHDHIRATINLLYKNTPVPLSVDFQRKNDSTIDTVWSNSINQQTFTRKIYCPSS